MGIFQISLILATFLCSLVAGLLFAFAVVVIPGISSLNGYKGIRKAPGAFSLIIREFHPIQDDCQTRTPINATNATRAIQRAIVFNLGGKWS